MNLGCLLWVIVGLIILWNISPGLVVVSVLGGIVAAIVKIKGSDIDEDKKTQKKMMTISSHKQVHSRNTKARKNMIKDYMRKLKKLKKSHKKKMKEKYKKVFIRKKSMNQNTSIVII